MSKTRMVEDWMPTEQTLIKMIGQFKEVNIQYEKDKFVDYYLANGGVSANWEATFRNWIRRADEYRTRNQRDTSTHVATGAAAVSDRRSRILSVAKQGDRESDGSIKRLPKRK